jgi:hypothetical protein
VSNARVQPVGVARRPPPNANYRETTREQQKTPSHANRRSSTQNTTLNDTQTALSHRFKRSQRHQSSPIICFDAWDERQAAAHKHNGARADNAPPPPTTATADNRIDKPNRLQSYLFTNGTQQNCSLVKLLARYKRNKRQQQTPKIGKTHISKQKPNHRFNPKQNNLANNYTVQWLAKKKSREKRGK